MDSTLDFLKRLARSRVEFVVVGGLAGVFHGSGVVTEDIDICAPLTSENLKRILAALDDLHPRFRMRPDRMSLPEDSARLSGFKNLYLETDLGQIDIVSEITGVGEFSEVSCHTIMVDFGGCSCKVLTLDALIRSKKALGRPKDLQVATELEAIRARLSKRP